MRVGFLVFVSLHVRGMMHEPNMTVNRQKDVIEITNRNISAILNKQRTAMATTASPKKQMEFQNDANITTEGSDELSAPISIEAQQTPSASNILLQIENVNSMGEPISHTKANVTNFTKETDLSLLDRKIWVVTTAAMPWRTGTSVNPLMRALYLTRNRPKHSVALVIPWLEDSKSRDKLYGEHKFANSSEQEAWIRSYARTRCQSIEEEPNLKIVFWKGSYHEGFGSIFPAEDICAKIPAEDADVAILEEPEHLNWFRVPKKDATANEDILGWAHKFKHVVGVVRCNHFLFSMASY